MDRAAILRLAHHVAEREKYAAQQHHAKEKSYQVPAFQHTIATAPFSASRHSFYFSPAFCIQYVTRSIGTGNTMVVFFSAPICASVCKYRN